MPESTPPRQPKEVFGQVWVAGDVRDVHREYPRGSKPSLAVQERCAQESIEPFLAYFELDVALTRLR